MCCTHHVRSLQRDYLCWLNRFTCACLCAAQKVFRQVTIFAPNISEKCLTKRGKLPSYVDSKARIGFFVNPFWAYPSKLMV
eukprot:g11981.t1